jgi:hypothetical protein
MGQAASPARSRPGSTARLTACRFLLAVALPRRRRRGSELDRHRGAAGQGPSRSSPLASSIRAGHWRSSCAAGRRAIAGHTSAKTATARRSTRGVRPTPWEDTAAAAGGDTAPRAGRLPAGRYPKMTARRKQRRMLAVQTPGRRGAILHGDDQRAPTIRRCGMPQVRITRQHRTANARRRPEPPLPLDPRDQDLVRAKHLQRRQARRGPGRSR